MSILMYIGDHVEQAKLTNPCVQAHTLYETAKNAYQHHERYNGRIRFPCDSQQRKQANSDRHPRLERFAPPVRGWIVTITHTVLPVKESVKCVRGNERHQPEKGFTRMILYEDEV